ncbi:unnamed protein product, partial [Didymodactylos carnosus]
MSGDAKPLNFLFTTIITKIEDLSVDEDNEEGGGKREKTIDEQIEYDSNFFKSIFLKSPGKPVTSIGDDTDDNDDFYKITSSSLPSVHLTQLLPITLLNSSSFVLPFVNQLSTSSSTFIWFQLFLSVIYHMAQKNSQKHILKQDFEMKYIDFTYFDYVSMFYDHTTQQTENQEYIQLLDQKHIQTFIKNYFADKSSWWYLCRQSFIYDILYKAFETYDIRTIYKFRTFITDLHKALKKLYKPCTLTVYRAQYMTLSDIKVMKANVGGLLSINTFLLATINKARSLNILHKTQQPKQQQRPVLFQIDVTATTKDTWKPFANITDYSCTAGDEILFTLGTAFYIDSVYEVNNILTIELLWNETVHEQLNTALEHYKNIVGNT